MGRGKRLNESEKKQILELKQQQLSVAKISKVIRRSRRVIHNFLKNVEDYGKKKSTGRPSSLSERDKRAILRVASNSQLTTKQIIEKSNVSASVSSVRRVLLSCKNIRRLKLKRKPLLTTKHKVVHWKKKWRKKRDNVSNSTTNGRRQRDGLDRHRLFGKTSIKFIDGRINSVRYINVIKEQINNHAERISGPDDIFQQDNASVHTSRLVQSYFNENNISILSWPARSTDRNIIENC